MLGEPQSKSPRQSPRVFYFAFSPAVLSPATPSRNRRRRPKGGTDGENCFCNSPQFDATAANLLLRGVVLSVLCRNALTRSRYCEGMSENKIPPSCGGDLIYSTNRDQRTTVTMECGCITSLVQTSLCLTTAGSSR